MLTPERHAMIIKMVKEKEVVKLRDLVSATSASESTIRRDLVELETMQKLKRIHGGASSIQGKASEPSISEKTSKNIQIKQQIAKAASEQVKDGDCIYLDAGSTTLEMIPYLQSKNITVVTNGLMHIEALVEYNIKSYILGGMMKGHTKAIIGSMAAENLRNYRFDKCFLGMNGIHTEYGYTTPDIEEALIKKIALAMSEKSYILADYSKFSEISFSKVADIEKAMIITDFIERNIGDYEKENNSDKGRDKMIYTVTLNPAIDYIVKVGDFQVGQLNRMNYDEKFAGGKGINVSRVLKRLRVDNKALGFLGGFTGGFIENVLKTEGVLTDFVQIDGDTRINIKLKSTTETEINGQGPTISASNMEEFMGKLEQIQPGDTLVLAGNVPASVPADLYEGLAKWGNEKGINVVVDASGKTLLDVVKHRPFLVKPNHHELGELFDTIINNAQEVIPYGKKLVEMGAQNVIVSMAGDGAILFTKENIYVANVPKGRVVNSVGAGDSLVAGFIGTYEKTGDIEASFQTAVATGSATAFSADLCTKEKIEESLPKVKIVKS